MLDHQTRWGGSDCFVVPTHQATHLLRGTRNASADIDPDRLAGMADTDPQAALQQLDCLGASILLMPELLPAAVRIAHDQGVLLGYL